MPKFSYKAIDTRGQVKSGVIEAADKAAAESELQRTGVKVQHLDMLREGKLETQVMKTIAPPGAAKPPTSGAMRVQVPPPPNPQNPASGTMRVTVPPPPGPGSAAMRAPVPPPPPKSYNSGEKTIAAADSGGTSRPATTPPARVQTSQPSGSIQRPAGLSLAPDPPPEPAPSSQLAPPEPAPAARRRQPEAVVEEEPQNLLKPFLALAMVAVGLVFLTMTAFTPPSGPPVEHQTINLSGQLPELPANTTVVFDFSDGSDIERSFSSLNVSQDGKFEVALEVQSRPSSFQVRARRPGEKDLVSPVCSMEGASGKLTGKLAVEKKPGVN